MADEDTTDNDDAPDDATQTHGQPADTGDTDTDQQEGAPKDQDDESGLGDAGKKALDAMKRERNAARRELASLRDQVKQFQDKDKSEAERLQEAVQTATARAATAESALKRREVAEERAPDHATAAQIRAVAKRLQGESDEDLETDADELFALLAPRPADPPARVPARPAERMPRGGGDPDEPPEESDPRKLAALIPRSR